MNNRILEERGYTLISKEQIEQAVKTVILEEGFERQQYLCDSGARTIGHGIRTKQIDEIFVTESEYAVERILASMKLPSKIRRIGLTSDRRVAFASITYQLGSLRAFPRAIDNLARYYHVGFLAEMAYRDPDASDEPSRLCRQTPERLFRFCRMWGSPSFQSHHDAFSQTTRDKCFGDLYTEYKRSYDRTFPEDYGINVDPRPHVDSSP